MDRINSRIWEYSENFAANDESDPLAPNVPNCVTVCPMDAGLFSATVFPTTEELVLLCNAVPNKLVEYFAKL